MMLNMTQCEKEGSDACLAGMPLNRNPYADKKGVIANLQRVAWDKGFLDTERNSKGA